MRVDDYLHVSTLKPYHASTFTMLAGAPFTVLSMYHKCTVDLVGESDGCARMLRHLDRQSVSGRMHMYVIIQLCMYMYMYT